MILAAALRPTLMAALCALLLAACAPLPVPERGNVAPLLHRPAETEAAETIAILVPGAIASIDIFKPAEAWRAEGVALAAYRFPGFDGLPLDHHLAIEPAAARIAAFANRYPDKRIRLLGYSTGAAIALSAAARMTHDDVRVAAVSPALPHAGGIASHIRGVTDLGRAALRTGSLGPETVGREYFRILLFGRAGRKDPARQNAIDAFDRGPGRDLVIPDYRMTAAHVADLRQWPGPRARTGPQIAFFTGLADPLFTPAQVLRFARGFGAAPVYGYEGQGHLLYLTAPRVFDDARRFLQIAKTAE